MSILDPAPRAKGIKYASEYTGKQVMEMTFVNGYSYGGTKSVEILKSLAEGEKRWYVLHCHFTGECINLVQRF